MEYPSRSDRNTSREPSGLRAGETFMRPARSLSPITAVPEGSFRAVSALPSTSPRSEACQSRDSVSASTPVTAVSRPIAPPFAVETRARAARSLPNRVLRYAQSAWP